MSTKLTTVAVALIAVIALVGTGLAVSYGSFLETNSNTVGYQGTGINILCEDNEEWVPLGTALTVNGPTPSIVGDTVSFPAGTVTIDDYRFDVDCATTGNVRCWLVLSDELSWGFIASATVKIDSGSPQDLIESSTPLGTETRGQSTVPVTFSNLSRGQHTFELVITYRAVTFDLSDGDSSKIISMADLADSRLVFELQ